MIEPIRYTGKTEVSILGSLHWRHPEGEWVKWEDYARLNSLIANSEQENARLKAEVERLTKYGDVLESGLRTLPGDFPRCLANEWKAAKEGKQS